MIFQLAHRPIIKSRYLTYLPPLLFINSLWWERNVLLIPHGNCHAQFMETFTYWYSQCLWCHLVWPTLPACRRFTTAKSHQAVPLCDMNQQASPVVRETSEEKGRDDELPWPSPREKHSSPGLEPLGIENLVGRTSFFSNSPQSHPILSRMHNQLLVFFIGR